MPPRKPKVTRKPAKKGRNTGVHEVDGEVYVGTQAAMARLFGVTAATIQGWRASGAPDPAGGQWPVGAWIRWRVAELENDTVDNATLELKRAQAELAKVKLAKERGLLVEARRAKTDLEQLATVFVGVLERMPSELAGKLLGKSPGEVKRIVIEHCNAARRELMTRVK